MASECARRRIGRRGSGPRPASGFVLAVTLWILAGIAIAVGLMTLWSLQQLEQARLGHERLDDELAANGTRDTLLYFASTRELTLAGLPVEVMSDELRATRRLDEMGSLVRDPIGGELALDGTVYEGLRGTRFAIQDEAGLFGVVMPRDLELDGFLISQGVDPEQVPRLRDALLDYIDSDELTRLNGAERREYEREGRPPPPNRRLLTPAEIGRVLGWDALEPALLAELPERITPYYSGAVNLNTAPAVLLPHWIPGCPETCDRLVTMRREQPFRSGYDLQARLGIALPGDASIDYRFLADESLRITWWGRAGAAWRMHVRLTPLADKRGPWSILAAHPVLRPPTDEPAEATGSPLLADPAPDRH